MLDAALDTIEHVRDGPVWRPVPPEVRSALETPLPRQGAGEAAVFGAMLRDVLPYRTGNIHPAFFGWVHGAGLPVGIVADMVAAAMDSNVGGRQHGAVYVERQVVAWCRELFGFPGGASGLVTTGTSMASLIALAVARHRATGGEAGRRGVASTAADLVGYASAEAHGSVAKAFALLGLGGERLRRVPVDAAFRLDPAALESAIAADRRTGLRPFCVIGTAGTVNTGAIDDLVALADLCAREGLWLHVDGAFGALAALSPKLRPLLDGIERADSLAFDFHKWAHVPYDAGFVLVRDGEAHRATFAERPAYLASSGDGLAGGEPWFCDFGPELSRGFRALKAWAVLKAHGAEELGRSIEANCVLARDLAERIARHPRLELLAPQSLGIVCFRYVAGGLDAAALNTLNGQVVATLQDGGTAAPSTTMLNGVRAIRVNITNHRTRHADVDRFLDAVLRAGDELAGTCRTR
jgi:aromatic-L-amino-acid decarboxylase